MICCCTPDSPGQQIFVLSSGIIETGILYFSVKIILLLFKPERGVVFSDLRIPYVPSQGVVVKDRNVK